MLFRRNPNPDLTALHKPHDLLEESQASIVAIRREVGINEQLFDHMYLESIFRTADLLQTCPRPIWYPREADQDLIAHILQNVIRALRLRKGVILPAGATAEVKNRKVDLYNYTVFISSLLHDIGALIDHTVIELFDRRNQYISEWHPAIGERPSDAFYWKVKRRGPATPPGDRTSSLLVAQRIMRADGYIWIRSDPVVFREFLSTFVGIPSGTLAVLVQRACSGETGTVLREAQDIEPGNNESVPDKEPSDLLVKSDQETVVEKEQPDENGKSVSESDGAENSTSGRNVSEELNGNKNSSPDGPGVEFLNWLAEGIDRSEIPLNEEGASVHAVEGGDLFLAYPAIFQKYAETDSSLAWENVERSFLSLGVHSDNPAGGTGGRWQGRIQRSGKMTLVKGFLVSSERLSINVDLPPGQLKVVKKK